MDEIKKYLACDGRVNIICVNTTDLVKDARNVHDLSPVATAALGRLLTMGAIMGARMKNDDESITLQIKGNGPIGKVTCVANGDETIKGYVDNNLVDIPLKSEGKLDVGGAVGNEGFLYVIKDIGLKDPYVGITPLVSGEIAEDFTKYFAESEQIPCITALGVLVDQNGVRKAGGYFLTLMPDATEEDITQVENAFKSTKPISKMLDEKMTLQEIAETVTGDKNLMVMNYPLQPRYRCDCNRDRFKGKLKTLPKEDVKDLFLEKDEIEAVCDFCGKKYYYKKEEIEE